MRLHAYIGNRIGSRQRVMKVSSGRQRVMKVSRGRQRVMKAGRE